MKTFKGFTHLSEEHEFKFGFIKPSGEHAVGGKGTHEELAKSLGFGFGRKMRSARDDAIKNGWVRYRHGGIKALSVSYDPKNEKATATAQKHVSEAPGKKMYDINDEIYTDHGEALRHFKNT